MTRDEQIWFARTFDAGNRPTLTPERLAALKSKARTLAEVAELAAMYEKRGATAGVVRLALEQRAKDARDLLEKLSPLGEAENIEDSASPSGDGEPSGESGRSRVGLAAVGVPSPVVESEPSPDPLELHEARVRLELIPDALQSAVAMLNSLALGLTVGHVTPSEAEKAARSTADFLRTVQAFCRGEVRVTLPPPEPGSLRVGPPALRVVKGEPAA